MIGSGTWRTMLRPVRMILHSWMIMRKGQRQFWSGAISESTAHPTIVAPPFIICRQRWKILLSHMEMISSVRLWSRLWFMVKMYHSMYKNYVFLPTISSLDQEYTRSMQDTTVFFWDFSEKLISCTAMESRNTHVCSELVIYLIQVLDHFATELPAITVNAGSCWHSHTLNLLLQYQLHGAWARNWQWWSKRSGRPWRMQQHFAWNVTHSPLAHTLWDALWYPLCLACHWSLRHLGKPGTAASYTHTHQTTEQLLNERGSNSMTRHSACQAYGAMSTRLSRQRALGSSTTWSILKLQ